MSAITEKKIRHSFGGIRHSFTLSYAKNKAVTNSSKTGEVRIKGKGNYKGKVTLYFAVTQQSLKAEGITISASDQFTTRQKLKKPSVTIIDIDGKKLKEGTDFKIISTGYSNNVKKGTARVTVQGINTYAGTKTLSFKIVQGKVDYQGALVGGAWK